MNLAGGFDGVVRNAALVGAEIAYVRKDSFWIQHEDPVDGEGSRAAQSTAPIFVETSVEDANQDVERSWLAHEGPWTAEERDLPLRGAGTLSALRVLGLTALAFALGIAVSPLVRSPRPPEPAALIATPAPVPVAPAPPLAAPAVPDAHDVALAPVAHASARTSTRDRPTSGLGATWSSRPTRKKAQPSEARTAAAPETTASPVDADPFTAKPSDKPREIAPSKTKEAPAPTAPKKPAAKAWVDPWAGDLGVARAG